MNKNLLVSAMRMAARKGVNPYDSRPAQGTAYYTLWCMRQGATHQPMRTNNAEISTWFHNS